MPIGWYGEGTTVRAYLVAVAVGHPVGWRSAHNAASPVVHLNLMLEDDTLVGVERISVFEDALVVHTRRVPVHRHLYTVPGRSVKVGSEEVLRSFVGMLGPVKLPLAVETLPQRRVLGQHTSRLVCIGKREEPGVWLLLVVGNRVGTLPLPARRLRHLSVEEAAKLCRLRIHRRCQEGSKDC